MRLFRARPRIRESGVPPSGNGASSFHLHWRMPPAPLVEVSATIEVLVAPTVPRLYFWALQVGFSDGSAAHTGLQWLPFGAGIPAVNWGGYGPGGRELDGTVSDLPSVDGNLNTRRFDWQAGVAHRLRVFPSPAGPGWRASVDEVVVRDLFAGGDHLTGPLVWSEVFAACDDPSVVVRWSGFEAVDRAGRVTIPDAVTVTYQGWADGGCTNTDVEVDDRGVRQTTGVGRRTPDGAVLPLPR
jgi:hypothetical protein